MNDRQIQRPGPDRSRSSRLQEAIARKEQRKLSARRQRDRSIWFGLGMFGLVGWSVAIPTLVFLALGIWMDGKWEGRISWTLTMLMVGIVLGCLNAWFWVKRESRHD